MKDQWTPRVDARTALANALLAKGPDAFRPSGLLPEDLEEIRDSGVACRDADRAQREEFAELKGTVTARKEGADDIDAREDALRDVLPLVIADLRENHLELSRWLANLSFARYRLRELTPAAGDQPPSEAEAAEQKKVLRVERGDLDSRFGSLDAFCSALLKPGREPVSERLKARGRSRATLEELRRAASAEAVLGTNKLARAASSELEAGSATRQRSAWAAARRAIRAACADDDELKKKLAAC